MFLGTNGRTENGGQVREVPGGNLVGGWGVEDMVPLAMTPRVGLPLHSGTDGQTTDVAAAQPVDLEPRFGGTPWQLAGKVLVDMSTKTPKGTPPRTVASSMATAPNDRTGVMMPPSISPQQFVHRHVLTKDRPQLFLHTCRKGGTDQGRPRVDLHGLRLREEGVVQDPEQVEELPHVGRPATQQQPRQDPRQESTAGAGEVDVGNPEDENQESDREMG